MNTDNYITSHAPFRPMQRPATPCRNLPSNAADWVSVPRWTQPAGFVPPPSVTSASSLELAGSPLIWLVDDQPHLTELYTFILEAKGCRVMAFNNRAEALATLKRHGRKPELLVIDHLGSSLPTDQFMNLCHQIYPGLRILMASGVSPCDVQFSSVRPDRFLQKPFTPEEFLSEVELALLAWSDR